MTIRIFFLLILVGAYFNGGFAQTARSISFQEFRYESAVYVGAEDKVYATRRDEQGLPYSNRLVVLNPIWGKIERSYQVGFNPRFLCKSSDEKSLFFLSDAPQYLKEFNLANKQVVKEIALPEGHFWTNLVAVPGGSNRLILASQRADSSYLWLVDRGAFRSQKVVHYIPERIIGFDFATDSTILAWNISTIFRLKINAEGITISQQYPNFSFAYNERGIVANNKIVTEKGRVFNLSQTQAFEEQGLPIIPFGAGITGAQNEDDFFVMQPASEASKVNFFRFKKSDLTLLEKWTAFFPRMNFSSFFDDKRLISTGKDGRRFLFQSEQSYHIAWNCIPIIKAPLLSPRGAILHCNSDSLFLKTDRQDISEITWTDASKGAAFFVPENGAYAAKYADSLGCQTNFSSPTSVTFISAPAAFSINFRDFGEVDTARICIGGKTTLRARSWDYVKKWLWSNGDTTQNISVAPGTYRYKAIAPDGCASRWSNPVVVLNRNDTIPPMPSIKTLNGAENFCIGDKIILETNPGYKYYYWNGLFNTSHRYEHPTFGNSNYTTTINVRYGNVVNCLSEVSANLLFKINTRPSKPEIKIQDDKITSNFQGIHQWYLNGQLLEGFTGNSIPLKGGGFYAAKFVSNNCVSDFSNLVPVSGKTTAVKDIFGIKPLQIQPNPAQDYLVVSLDGISGKAAQLRLFSADGKEQERRNIDTGTKGALELNVSQLSRGVYFLEIKTSEAHFLGKFIKL